MRLCYAAGTDAEPLRETVDYESLQQPLSPLFLDFLAGRERAFPFFGSEGFDLEAVDRAGATSLGLARPRREVASALVRQQRARSAESAAARAQALAEPESLAIVTGQQAGLFGGPLLVLLKAVATLELARQLEDRRKRPVVPVFWVASDDHDFAEVRSTCVIDATGSIRCLRYAPKHEPVRVPASSIVLDDTIAGLVDELERTLSATARARRRAASRLAMLPPRARRSRRRSRGSWRGCCRSWWSSISPTPS